MARRRELKMVGMAKEIDRPVDLVTGATSKLGSFTAKRLIEKGHEVRALIKEGPNESAKWKMLPQGAVPYIGDITLKRDSDQLSIETACKGVDNIFHVASAMYNYRHTYDELLEINVIGTENIINIALDANKNKPLRFIAIGSVSVYGYRRPGEVLTEESNTHPESNYSKSKMMQEEVTEAYAASNPGFKYSILRLGNLYGPGYEESFFKVFKLLKEGKLRYIGNGRNHLPLLYVNDAADAIVGVSESPKTINETYNVSDGEPHTVRELYETAARLLGIHAPTKSVSPVIARLVGGSVGLKYDEYEFLTSDRIISIDKIMKDTGFRPKIGIEEGGKEMIDAFKKTAR